VARLIVAFAGLSAFISVAACGRISEATEKSAVPATAAHSPAQVPDVEADSIPTAAGIPLVPITGPIPAVEAPLPGPARQTPAVYNTSHTAVTIIKEEETLQLKAYELGGYWQIGYGHLMLEGEKDEITEPEAEAFLIADLVWCEGAIERYVAVPITLNEFSAMVAFYYNIGSGKTRGSSVVRRINTHDRLGAANAFLLWNRMNGVVMQALAKRRARERTLFLTP
jgi:lysozyme